MEPAGISKPGKFENRPLGPTISPHPKKISARSNPVSQFQEVPRARYLCLVVAVGTAEASKNGEMLYAFIDVGAIVRCQNAAPRA